jgi:hypothetical protein
MSMEVFVIGSVGLLIALAVVWTVIGVFLWNNEMEPVFRAFTVLGGIVASGYLLRTWLYIVTT